MMKSKYRDSAVFKGNNIISRLLSPIKKADQTKLITVVREQSIKNNSEEHSLYMFLLPLSRQPYAIT